MNPSATDKNSTESSSPAKATRLVGPTRVALVGAGFIADFHLEILSAMSDVEVVCICDADIERARSAARRFGVEHAVDNIADLAKHSVQVAHVAVPPTLHKRVARELLEHNVGVFVEKPLALSSADARELKELAQKHDLPLAVNHNACFHPSFQKLLKQIENGDIGRVEHVQVTLSVPLRQLDAGDFSHWMFAAPRNIIFEQCPHPFAQLFEILGPVQAVDRTILQSRELQPGQVFHQRWLLAARAERGTAEIYLAFGSDFTRSTIQVLGTDGSLQADLFHDHMEGERKTLHLDFWNSFLAGHRRGKQLKGTARKGLTNYMRQTLGLGARQDAFFAGMRDSMKAFHKALRDGTDLPAGPTQGVGVLEWCEAATDEIAGDPKQAPRLPEAGPVRPGEVLVLGGTGFIGRPTVQRLLDADVPVTCVVRRAHSLPPFLLKAAESGKLRLVRGSLESTASMQEMVRGTHTVLQLATGGGANWEAIQRSMVDGSVALARACMAEDIKRFVYVSSTAALYLGADAGQTVSDDEGPDPKPEVRALYARGKIAAEQALMELHRKEGLPLSVVRPAVVLGAGSPMQHSGIGLWVRDNHCVGWGPGDTPLPVVWVEDVAEALARLCRHKGSEPEGKYFNLAAECPITAREMVDELRKCTQRDLHFHPRSLGVSQTMEVGKWLVKKAGRKNAEFPSWRDLKSRAMVPKLTCENARNLLGWRPVESREALLEKVVQCHKPQAN